MKRLLPILILFLAIAAQAASSRISATLTVTNGGTNTATVQWGLLVNGSFRVFTNAQSSSSILSNTTIGGTATNVYSNTFLFPFTGLIVTMPATNQIKFVGGLGASLVVTGTNWSATSYSTSIVDIANAIRVPFSVETLTNRSNFASLLISDLSTYSSNSWATNAKAMSNYPNFYDVTNILNVSVGGKLNATNGTAVALIATNASRINVTNLWATNAYLSNLVASNFSTSNLFTSNAQVGTLYLNATNILTNKISVTFGLNSNTATTVQLAHVLSNLFDAIQNHKLILVP